MSHITLAQQGLAAAEARNWDEAIEKLSVALKTSQNPLWLINRSKALINRKKFQEALDDANLAWHTAYERNKRPLLIDAHYRRAVAYFRLGQYANADACCIYAMRLVKGFPAVEKQDPARIHTDENGFYKMTLKDAHEESATDEINQSKGGALAVGSNDVPNAKDWRIASTLRMQILFAMDKLPEDDPARKLTTSVKPERKDLSDLGVKKNEPTKEPAPTTTQSAPKPVVPADTPLRIQEFQNDANMIVSIFSKGVNKEKLQVRFTPSSVHLDSVIMPSGEEKPFTMNFWSQIDADASTCRVTPNKVELSLKKATPGKWKQLKSDATDAAPDTETDEYVTQASIATTHTNHKYRKLKVLKEARQKAMDSADASAKAAPAEEKPAPSSEDKGKAPAVSQDSSKPAVSYPSSSRTGPKDWDKVGDDIDSDEEKDVNVFFKKLFKGANPEQQRAMMKSFTESNGTSLSTDWSDVKDRKVETVPPEGVEAKKW
jgi:hypothetical protein